MHVNCQGLCSICLKDKENKIIAQVEHKLRKLYERKCESLGLKPQEWTASEVMVWNDIADELAGLRQ